MNELNLQLTAQLTKGVEELRMKEHLHMIKE